MPMNDPKNIDEYQQLTRRTAGKHHSKEFETAVLSMGLAGEAGELIDLLKKHLAHGHPLDKELLIKEAGDRYLVSMSFNGSSGHKDE